MITLGTNIRSELEGKEQPKDITDSMATCKKEGGKDALMALFGYEIRFVCPYISLNRPEYASPKEVADLCPLAKYKFTPMRNAKEEFYRPSCGAHNTIGQ